MFGIWISLMLHQIFISKWNRFCYYMIASKHDSFVLLQSIEGFQQQCEDLLKNITDQAEHYEVKDLNNYETQKTKDNSDQVRIEFFDDTFIHEYQELKQPPFDLREEFAETKSWPWNIGRFLFKHGVIEHDERILFASKSGPIAVAANCAMIVILSFLANQQDINEHCTDTNNIVLKYSLITTCIVLVICIGSMTRRLWNYLRSHEIFNSDLMELLSGIVFSLFSSQIFVYCYMLYFYENEQC
eukprot:380934_1